MLVNSFLVKHADCFSFMLTSVNIQDLYQRARDEDLNFFDFSEWITKELRSIINETIPPASTTNFKNIPINPYPNLKMPKVNDSGIFKCSLF